MVAFLRQLTCCLTGNVRAPVVSSHVVPIRHAGTATSTAGMHKEIY